MNGVNELVFASFQYCPCFCCGVGVWIAFEVSFALFLILFASICLCLCVLCDFLDCCGCDPNEFGPEGDVEDDFEHEWFDRVDE